MGTGVQKSTLLAIQRSFNKAAVRLSDKSSTPTPTTRSATTDALTMTRHRHCIPNCLDLIEVFLNLLTYLSYLFSASKTTKITLVLRKYITRGTSNQRSNVKDIVVRYFYEFQKPGDYSL